MSQPTDVGLLAGISVRTDALYDLQYTNYQGFKHSDGEIHHLKQKGTRNGDKGT
ncbi:hypothetical protein [Coprobacter tertius]|uniref:Uncharacterized protein n=1 Tax=Coprobacter tertius TaxID=2944915 RepID=A0ABT1MJJ5_9BACT|nr:hypothetical protein [Coprobacter tertius]MCP9612800.1 hypothetical protein [Coprobacter tertius]